MARGCCRRRGSVFLAAGCGGDRLCAAAERLSVVSVLSPGDCRLSGGRRSPPTLAAGTCKCWRGVWRSCLSVDGRHRLAMALGGCLLTGGWRPSPAEAACCFLPFVWRWPSPPALAAGAAGDGVRVGRCCRRRWRLAATGGGGGMPRVASSVDALSFRDVTGRLLSCVWAGLILAALAADGRWRRWAGGARRWNSRRAAGGVVSEPPLFRVGVTLNAVGGWLLALSGGWGSALLVMAGGCCRWPGGWRCLSVLAAGACRCWRDDFTRCWR